MYRNSSQFNSSSTPRPIKFLIGTALFFSLSSTLSLFISSMFSLPTFLEIFSLSARGVSHLYLWQFLTNFFIIPTSPTYLFTFVLQLLFSLYTLYFVSSSIARFQGVKEVFKIFLIGGLISSITAFFILSLLAPGTYFCGFSAALFALLTAWMFLFPDQPMLYFFIPLRVKWLVALLLFSSLFSDLSSGNLLSFTTSITGSFCGYLYGLLGWKTHSPIQMLQGFENKVLSLFTHSLKRPYSSKNSYTSATSQKEQQFLDAMLDKISIHGQESLTWIEKWKLKRIFRKKRGI